ncbi:MAG: hydroxysqualene dehydroxylase HpnE [Nocardioidaceae bacterium]
MSEAQPRVVVVGGGLAGISAALGLADAGWAVTLLETRARLGGATYSFQREGLAVDTGQHVLLRCYTEHRALLARLGVASKVPVQPRLEIPVLAPGRPVAWLRRDDHGPPPMHLGRALLGYPALSWAERIQAVRAAAALRRVDFADPLRDRETFGAWLHAHGQSDRALTRLWGLVCVAALNLQPDEASLALAARVFRTGLLDDVSAGDIAVPQVPLGDLHDGPARRLLERLGVRVATSERVLELTQAGGGVVARTSSGEVESDAVVVAVPHRHAAGLVPPEAVPDRDRWAGLGAAPIVNVHVRYDRAVAAMPMGFAAVLDSPVPWVFDRTASAGADGQYLVVSISAADAELGRQADDLAREHQEALTRLFPAARDACVLDSFVTREPHATFRQGAGVAALRPPAQTRSPSVWLAGSWTGTGWPDTMEGAVRSGASAASQVGTPDQARRLTEVSG